MARTALVPTTLPRLPDMTPTADSADTAFAAADQGDGNNIPYTGKEILIVRNDNAGAQTVTIAGNADEIGRAGSITAYSVGIAETAVFDLSHQAFNTSGFIDVNGSAADVMLGVVVVSSMP